MALKITYWISTGLLSLLLLFSAWMYLFNYEAAAGFYVHLGFPLWMIYPSAIAKMLALLAIWSRLSNFLKEWAYAGVFFDLVMATAAHLMAGDGALGFATFGLLFIALSYWADGKLHGNALLPKR